MFLNFSFTSPDESFLNFIFSQLLNESIGFVHLIAFTTNLFTAHPWVIEHMQIFKKSESISPIFPFLFHSS